MQFWDSEQIMIFQEAYASLFSNCYNKQVIQSDAFLLTDEPISAKEQPASV